MIQGGFGPVHPFAVEGWAHDDTDLGAQVEIEILVDGARVGGTVAGDALPERHHRAGGVEHGFFFSSPLALPSNERHRLTVTARGVDGRPVPLPFVLPQAATIISPQPSFDDMQRPVFILGSVRSGTTALMEAMRSCTRYSGPGEGHLLELSLHLTMLVERFYAERSGIWGAGYDTLITSIPQTYMLDAVRHVFVELARSRFPSGRWLDKTPRSNMIAAAPLLRSIWPGARFVFCKRRGIDNVASRLRRMPETTFEDHCRDWALCMSNWLAVRDRLAGASLEVEHLTMARQPAVVVDALTPVLSLEQSEAERMTAALSSHHHERSGTDPARVLDLDQMGWADGEKSAFHRICGPMMHRYGYSTVPGLSSNSDPAFD